ncbi:MAG: penicillin-binding protein, partial [Bacteroidales bacterium]|nr:penicillin-binding protein [Bacteroidales bacterium]
IVLHFRMDTHTEGAAPYFREFLRLFISAKKPDRANYAEWQGDVYHEDSLLWETNPLYGWCNKNKKINGEYYNVYNDGLTIYTTIDSRMQKYAEDAVVEHMGKGFKVGTFTYDGLQTLFEKSELQKHKKMKFGGKEFDRPFSARISEAQTLQIINQAVKRSERWRVGKNVNKLDSATIIKQFLEPVPMTVFSWQHPEGVDTVMSPMDSILYYKKFLRCGMMSMEPQSGHVKAYVGGINYKYFQYDHVSLGRRQVGSTFKPFVYAGMFLNRHDITPEHTLANVEYSFDNPGGVPPVYTPRFSKSSKDGQMISLKTGLALSLNQISGWCMKSVSPTAVVALVHRMGVISPIENVPSICVGAVELKIREMVAAYCVFANHGQSTSPVFVTKIVDKNGNVVGEFNTIHKEAMNEIAAYKMVEMLRGVTHGGTASRLVMPGFFGLKGDIGGKTGTTNLCADGWFMGISPRLVSGVWAGGEDRSVQFSNGELGQGARMAMPVWGLYMKKISEDPVLSKIYPDAAKFEQPENYTDYENNERQSEGKTIDNSVDLDEFNDYIED